MENDKLEIYKCIVKYLELAKKDRETEKFYLQIVSKLTDSLIIYVDEIEKAEKNSKD